LGKSILEWLVEEPNRADYAVFIYAADDIAELRGRRYLVARDNVVLEHGLFIGGLGRERVFFLTPIISDLRLPSDLEGTLHGTYDASADNQRIAVGPFCRQLKETVSTAESAGWTTVTRGGQLWEVAKIGEAYSKSVRLEHSRRLSYGPS